MLKGKYDGMMMTIPGDLDSAWKVELWDDGQYRFIATHYKVYNPTPYTLRQVDERVSKGIWKMSSSKKNDHINKVKQHA